VVAREGGEMARLGGLFMGEHGLVVDVAQGRSWGVGELAIGGVSARVRSDAVANGEWARRCSSLTMAVVASHACSGRGVARVHAKGREVLRRSGRFEQVQRGEGDALGAAWRRVAASSAPSTGRPRTAACGVASRAASTPACLAGLGSLRAETEGRGRGVEHGAASPLRRVLAHHGDDPCGSAPRAASAWRTPHSTSGSTSSFPSQSFTCER
jgi:hypothetical protein